MTHPHLAALDQALRRFDARAARIEEWGRRLACVLQAGGGAARMEGGGGRLAWVLRAGGRLLAWGNGGSAEQAQPLPAELVGRYEDERPPFAAIPLHADLPTLTAIVNDYGPEEMYARQV